MPLLIRVIKLIRPLDGVGSHTKERSFDVLLLEMIQKIGCVVRAVDVEGPIVIGNAPNVPQAIRDIMTYSVDMLHELTRCSVGDKHKRQARNKP